MKDRDTNGHFDRQKAADYDKRWAPLAPLNESLHLQMSLILEELPRDAQVLCVGAGTGAELLALARRFSNWRFVAVDPSAPMLEICQRRANEQGLADRCAFHVGYAHEMPDTLREFDAATSILVSHFLTQRPERLRFFEELRDRLRSGGLLITSELSLAPSEQHRELVEIWRRMMRLTGADEAQIEAMLACYGREVCLLPQDEMEALLQEAEFVAPTQFSQSLLIRCWFARRN